MSTPSYEPLLKAIRERLDADFILLDREIQNPRNRLRGDDSVKLWKMRTFTGTFFAAPHPTPDAVEKFRKEFVRMRSEIEFLPYLHANLLPIITTPVVQPATKPGWLSGAMGSVTSVTSALLGLGPRAPTSESAPPPVSAITPTQPVQVAPPAPIVVPTQPALVFPPTQPVRITPPAPVAVPKQPAPVPISAPVQSVTIEDGDDDDEDEDEELKFSPFVPSVLSHVTPLASMRGAAASVEAFQKLFKKATRPAPIDTSAAEDEVMMDPDGAVTPKRVDVSGSFAVFTDKQKFMRGEPRVPRDPNLSLEREVDLAIRVCLDGSSGVTADVAILCACLDTTYTGQPPSGVGDVLHPFYVSLLGHEKERIAYNNTIRNIIHCDPGFFTQDYP